MTTLHGKVIEARLLTEQQKREMYALMEEFYEDTDLQVFLRDLAEKDYSILLFDEEGKIQGFSTQKILCVEVEGEKVCGVFSGDTIIHKEHWGSMELARLFGRYFMEYGKRCDRFYWFLISKGYKTYKMLPLYFREYYPNYKTKTPEYEQKLMDAYAIAKYDEEYDKVSGLILYKGTKDKLKPGVADITDRQLEDKDIQHFLKLNPEYYKGYDLVCLARFSEENIRPRIKRLILGK